MLSVGQPLHVILFAALIIGFAFFYVALVYDARDTAENLKKAGAFIPGIRPGQQTGDYLDKVLTRLTLWGGLYIMIVCLLPEIIRMVNPSIPFQFGGTSLLIIVVGVMDFIAQASSHMMSQQYEGLMKKASLRGIGGSVRNESSSFGEEDLQKLQSRAAARDRLHHLFVGRPAQTAPGLIALHKASELISRRFSNILARFFACAVVEK